MLNELLPPKARKTAYLVYAVLGVLLGSIQQGFSAADMSQPVWISVAVSVFVYVGTSFGIVAAGNVSVNQFEGRITPAG